MRSVIDGRGVKAVFVLDNLGFRSSISMSYPIVIAVMSLRSQLRPAGSSAACKSIKEFNEYKNQFTITKSGQ